jgi:hypothetical protein
MKRDENEERILQFQAWQEHLVQDDTEDKQEVDREVGLESDQLVFDVR